MKDHLLVDKYLDIAREMKKLWNMRETILPIVVGALGTIPKGLVKGVGKVGNQRTRRDHSNYSSVNIGQNTEMSPGDLRRLVTQT